MALPSPVADFPDMSGLISANQARAQQIMAAAWSQAGSIGVRPQAPPPTIIVNQQAPGAESAQGAAGGYESLAGYGQSNTGYQPNIRPDGSIARQGPDTRTLLAQTLQGEAGGEGFDGMLAVGSVINNRTRSGKYGGSTLDEVIMAPGQFSMWNGVTGYANGSGALDVDKLKISEDAYRAADLLLSGNYQDITGGATHYYNPAVANPKWGQQSGGNWQTIGNHVFGFADGRRGAHPRKASS